MNKIIESAKEAVKVAKCDHDKIPQPSPSKQLDKFYCTKCHATFWEPRPKWRS